MKAERITLLFAVALVAGAGLLPLLIMAVGSLTVDGEISLAAYGTLLRSPREWRLLGNSLALAACTAIAATAVGLPLGILFAKTDLPFRRTFAILFTVPLLF